MYPLCFSVHSVVKKSRSRKGRKGFRKERKGLLFIRDYLCAFVIPKRWMPFCNGMTGDGEGKVED